MGRQFGPGTTMAFATTDADSDGPVRVLYVDGDADGIDAVRTHLERERGGFEVLTAGEPGAALELLTKSDVDCVVCTHDIPDTDGLDPDGLDPAGLDLLEAVRAEFDGLPFILYTGSGSQELASRAFAEGATDYVRKGADGLDRLADSIQSAVSEHLVDRAVERRMRALEGIFDGIAFLSNDGVFTSVNETYADIAGYEPGDIVGADWGLLFADSSVADFDQLLRQTDVEGAWTGRTEFRRGDGARRSVELGIHAADGDVVVSTLSAVDERESVRERLSLREQAMDEAPVGITITDPSREDNPVIYANDRFRELTGYTDEEIVGRNCRFLQGDGTESEPVDRMREAIAAEEPVTVELRNYRKDGSEFWNRVSIAPLRDEAGTVVNYVGFQEDISDQRRREEVLRELYEIISDRHQSFEEQVDALLELGRAELDTDYGSLSEIRGSEYIFEVVSADDDSITAGDVVPVSATNCEVAVERQETLVLGDVARDAPDETDRAGYTDWGIACYLGAPVYVDDEVYGTFCFYGTEPRKGQFSDWEVTLVDLMSRWVSYELQRREANERLHRTNEQLEQFSSVVSHDLRNPLDIATSRLELAMDECTSEHLDHVERAHDRMATLISDLLTLAREGAMVTDTTRVELAGLARGCWQNVDTADATLVADVDSAIRADESRLRQLFENLVRNSVEHGGDDVTVTVGEIEDGSGFFVADDGPGIPPDERERVFEGGYSTTRQGTGFGLRIVQQIAEAHDWEIRATESADGGARFEITGVEFC